MLSPRSAHMYIAQTFIITSGTFEKVFSVFQVPINHMLLQSYRETAWLILILGNELSSTNCNPLFYGIPISKPCGEPLVFL